MTKLSNKEEIFCREYDIDKNGSRALKAAGSKGKPNSLATEASKLLKKPEVQARLAELRKERLQKSDLKAEEILNELRRLALYDPRKLFHTDGTPKPIHELDDDTAKCIAGLEVMEQWEGTGRDRKFVGYVKRYKLTDKNPSIDKAMKHLGLYKPQEHDHKGKIEVVVSDYREKSKK